MSNNYVNCWIQTQGNNILPRAAVAGSQAFLNELDGCCTLSSSLQPFYHKQVIDRVLAAPPSLHSPSHYYQLALFSLLPAIGERCGLISSPLDFHNKRGVKEREQSEMEQQGMIDIASKYTAAVMFSSIPTLLHRNKDLNQIVYDKTSNQIWLHNPHVPLSQYDAFSYSFLNASHYSSPRPVCSCLQPKLRLYFKTHSEKCRGNTLLWASQDMFVFGQQYSVKREPLT